MTRRITVIIATYNGLRYLVPCLRALAAQTFREFQIIVVDDGSGDGTLDVVRRNFPAIAVVRFPTNGGLARAHNAAIAASDGAYVVLLNNDTEPEPRWLERLVAAADASPDAWAVACKLRLWDRRDRLHAAGDGFGADGVPRNLGVWERDDGQWDDGRWLWGPQGGAALYRRAALRALSSAATGDPFDVSFFMYCEDVDLNWRARLAGYRTAFAPDAVVYHHLSATGGGRLASYFVGRNTLAVLIKDVPATLLRRHWRAIARAQLRIARESLRHLREPAARARLRGQIAVLPMLPALLRARAIVQSHRTISDAALERDLIADRR
ncbi:MAG TPA: glycosyltransferase family 2 protein [Thermomicrobiales bacterium]